LDFFSSIFFDKYRDFLGSEGIRKIRKYGKILENTEEVPYKYGKFRTLKLVYTFVRNDSRNVEILVIDPLVIFKCGLLLLEKRIVEGSFIYFDS